MASPIFKVKGVSKVFDRRIVLENINLEINAGEIFGVIGASGSGKSTLLNMLIGFIRPEAGDVYFKNERLSASKHADTFRSVFKHNDDLKKILGMASQTPSFYLNLTVKENLRYFGNLYNLSSDALKANINTLINLMDLQGSENRLGKNLSGGMQRRLDMACALIHDPKILILDEPTADLDPLLRNHIWRLVKKINKRGTTIILASHHLSELEDLCTRIAIVKDGKILSVGTPNEIKERFAKYEEIQIETFPGNYSVLTKIRDSDVNKEIINIEDKGTKLIIQTPKPELVLMALMKKIEEHKETLIDLKVERPSLDEIFINISESEEDKKEEAEEAEDQKKKRKKTSE